MTRYKIVITKDTVNDLKRYLSYIKYNLKNKQALKNVRDDFDLTSASLSKTAGAIPDPESPKLISRGLKRLTSNNTITLYFLESGMIRLKSYRCFTHQKILRTS